MCLINDEQKRNTHIDNGKFFRWKVPDTLVIKYFNS